MESLETLADRYFSERLETTLDALLAPIAGDSPAGVSLTGSETYSAIRIAREEEDASLPLGQWERELKRADWGAASRSCAYALATQSKDLQLAAWMLEAEIHRNGFSALAPCLTLLDLLCKTCWPQLYPQDLAHRDNIFRWVAEKLSKPLKLVPFTKTGSGVDYGWADWEQAQHNEQIRAALGRDAEQSIEGTTLAMFSSALACTPSPDILGTQDYLSAALTALARLDETLVAQLGDDAPLFDALRDLIENIALMLASEARKRGLRQEQAAQNEATGVACAATAVEPIGSSPASPPVSSSDRARLYNSLSQLADQLAVLEPHSPVPYLISRAVAWGGLNTAQLYNEVFVRCGGQINIFELLGLEEQIAAQEEPTEE